MLELTKVRSTPFIIHFPLSLLVGTGKGYDRFKNPAAVQRAAGLLGINHEELAKDIFNPPRMSSRTITSMFSPSSMGSNSDACSVNFSMNSYNVSPGTARANRSISLDAFVMGLYEQAVNALVMLINRLVTVAIYCSYHGLLGHCNLPPCPRAGT